MSMGTDFDDDLTYKKERQLKEMFPNPPIVEQDGLQYQWVTNAYGENPVTQHGTTVIDDTGIKAPKSIQFKKSIIDKSYNSEACKFGIYTYIGPFGPPAPPNP